MDDHEEGREPAAGDPAEQKDPNGRGGPAGQSDPGQSGQPDTKPSSEADSADPDTSDNPLARIDPDSDVVADAAAAKGGVNDPADDPLWNPALEPQDPQAPQGTKKQE
ncbi:hypothetical protein [Arthrobacter sp. H14-L1]|uniref:hypothetical protein n=1 Tax=Arthrobacter sp. H14-L1 TaxID=2996697 RepID=UPI0022702F4A|nr:hypothetical protein [Arthrobacter sp. H14-L1]MCY0906640.1 hypothetical protein [Arthrobacter sp. H14-L1]